MKTIFFLIFNVCLLKISLAIKNQIKDPQHYYKIEKLPRVALNTHLVSKNNNFRNTQNRESLKLMVISIMLSSYWPPNICILI